MRHICYDEAIGPECFGGDEYRADEPNPEEQERAEAKLVREERLYAAEREKASRAELVNEARDLLRAFPCITNVQIACESHEVDDDRGSNLYSQEKVRVTFAPNASLDDTGIDSLNASIEALQSSAQNYAVAAGLLDRTLTITRDGEAVK